MTASPPIAAPGAWPPPRQPGGGPMPQRVISEYALLQLVKDLARWHGLLVYHTHDSRRSDPGFPDVVIAGPRGVLFRELKSATGRLTLAQRLWREGLGEAGADFKVWTPREWCDGTIVAELRALTAAAPPRPQPEG